MRPDGRLDLSKLLAAFQEFFREHSEHWIEHFDYKEAGPQLLLQALPPARRQRRRTHRTRVRPWPAPHRLARRLAPGHPAAEGRDQAQNPSQAAGKSPHGRARANRRVHGPMRDGRRAPAHLRPQDRTDLGREDLQAGGGEGWEEDCGVGRVAGRSRRAAGPNLPRAGATGLRRRSRREFTDEIQARSIKDKCRGRQATSSRPQAT